MQLTEAVLKEFQVEFSEASLEEFLKNSLFIFFLKNSIRKNKRKLFKESLGELLENFPEEFLKASMEELLPHVLI